MWVTETEPEYDAEEQESWQALVEYEDAVCPHCGQLRSICSNPDGLDGRGFYPQRDICYLQAAAQRAQRKFLALHEKAVEDEAGYLPSDGVSITASPLDLTPDDNFLSTPEDELLAAVVAQATDQLDDSHDRQDETGEYGKVVDDFG